jgi:cytochrome c oxidase cbb3-type subunit IV
MEISHYDTLRHFADSWGLLFMLVIFAAAIVIVLLPGAKQSAARAARIPLDDTHPEDRRS